MKKYLKLLKSGWIKIIIWFLFLLFIYNKMPVYKNNDMNRRLGRVGKKWGKGITTGPDRYLNQQTKDEIAKRRERVKAMKKERVKAKKEGRVKVMGESTRYGKFALPETEKKYNWSDKYNESDAGRDYEASRKYDEFSKEMADIKNYTKPMKKKMSMETKKIINSMPTKLIKGDVIAPKKKAEPKKKTKNTPQYQRLLDRTKARKEKEKKKKRGN